MSMENLGEVESKLVAYCFIPENRLSIVAAQMEDYRRKKAAQGIAQPDTNGEDPQERARQIAGLDKMEKEDLQINARAADKKVEPLSPRQGEWTLTDIRGPRYCSGRGGERWTLL